MNKFVSSTYYVHMAKDYVLPHKHGHYELIYYAKGNGNITINKETFSYNEDTIALVEPQLSHDEYAESATEVYCLVFEADEKLFQNAVIQKDSENCRLLEILYISLQAINKSKEYEQCDYENEMDYIMLILMQILNTKLSNQKAYSEQIAQYTVNYIKNNYMYKMSFEIIAQKLNYSYDRFRHMFKEFTGESLYQYVLGVRLSSAKEYLSQNDINITYIAKKSGFKSLIRFSNWFKEKTGISPKNYRNIIKEQNNESIINGVYNSKRADK